MPSRWGLAALLFLSTVINYVDRQTLSVLAPILTKELELSPTTYAAITTAFLAAYTVMYLGSGLLVDRFGARLSMAAFMAWWSVASVLHAWARGPMSLGAFRFLLGLGESGNFMAAFKTISEWYPPRQRAFVNGLVQAGATAGAVMAPPLVVWLASTWGWRAAFVLTGLSGFVWLLAWLWVYPAGAASSAPAATGDKVRWRALLAYRQTWGLFGARFLSDPVWWFYLFWLPKYLVEHLGFTVREMAMLAWLPYLTADLGALAGGYLSDRLVRSGRAPLAARLSVMLPFAAIMPLSIVVGFSPPRAVCLVLICIVTFAHMGWKTNQTTLTNDLYPAAVVGSVSGMLAFGNGLGGTIFTALTGLVVQNLGYGAIFVFMGILHPLSYLILRRMVREPIPQ